MVKNQIPKVKTMYKRYIIWIVNDNGQNSVQDTEDAAKKCSCWFFLDIIEQRQVID